MFLCSAFLGCACATGGGPSWEGRLFLLFQPRDKSVGSDWFRVHAASSPVHISQTEQRVSPTCQEISKQAAELHSDREHGLFRARYDFFFFL